jgi:hypothetical protein
MVPSGDFFQDRGALFWDFAQKRVDKPAGHGKFRL